MESRKDEKVTYLECDTIFFQGANCSQTQVLRYTGNQRVVATTGEVMWTGGVNNLQPLHAIYNLHLGPEISDVNLQPFRTGFDYFNPITVIYSAMTRAKNYFANVHVSSPISASAASVLFHAPNLSEMSYGQASDIMSHRRKYLEWQNRADKRSGIILWGVSRGTAATFCAFSQFRYSDVKLVVLEGAVDSIENVLRSTTSKMFHSERVSHWMVEGLNSTVSYLNAHGLFGYRRDGESPLKSLHDFPESVPVVFITSRADTVVPLENTENIATQLAARGKNPVYLLKLNKSSHPYYMYDDKDDRDTYEAFIHAVYRKYRLQHDAELADKGEIHLGTALLSPRSSSELRV